MNKKGFVFFETITVLIVVIISITIMYASYSAISRKTKAKLYYDKASDKYMVYSLYNLGKSESGDDFNITNIMNDEKYETLKQITGLVSIHLINDGDYNYDDYLNGTIEYIKTLQKCNLSLVNGVCKDSKEYIIGVFKRNEKYYYASIEI